MDRESLEKRPAIVVVGSPNVGKRTLLSRLLSVDFEDASDESSELVVRGWTINTKYYTADVSVWMAHLCDGLSIESFPIVDRIVALVMVFDVCDPSSLVALKDWVSGTDIRRFDILLCIGNKVDLLPGHSAHTEYKRRLLKHGESSVNPQLDSSEYGISETEGSLSVDGDSQGVDRLYGALSAHMWPGMLLKSESEEESDYEPEYEKLSSGSAEPWDDVGWMSADGPVSTSGTGGPLERDRDILNRDCEAKSGGEDCQPSTSASQLPEALDREEANVAHEAYRASELDEDKAYDFEDLEMLMAEIGNMRSGLRLMPDFQRREMAAKLAMKMAAMFWDSSGGEEEFD
ncbi:hypothetical protein Sango_0165500 [Sesamum angolense]|uniref:Uncharacterized protein n=1 Tax=Sesamum angolense TaxID=2727404 RepID=A0AAE1XFB0_9LAMI|nr:hypothetical protein Sango_0165500 [Sesamum angolense]